MKHESQDKFVSYQNLESSSIEYLCQAVFYHKFEQQRSLDVNLI